MQLYAYLAPRPGLHLEPTHKPTPCISSGRALGLVHAWQYLIPDPDAYFETRRPKDLWCHLGGGPQYNDMRYLYLHALVLA